MEVKTKLTEKGQKDYLLVREAVDKGDQRAYSELMDRYKDTIYFMLLKMAGNTEDAEDLTVEAFGKAFKNLEQYTPDYAFSTWLFKIASNNCIDFLRKKKKNVLNYEANEELNESYKASNLPSDTGDPEEKLLRSQKVKMMREVVDGLKPRYRQLIELRYFQELSYEEICEELNLPLGTVKAQLFRAREFLYNILKNSRDNF
ncbi:MAG: sigma-70 family RNA polymerase sigma factor [Bacteroidales bacterium]|jgi:RNA polymerase sigma-70 factor (ECF subfamily)|nr:sigma-70 family RNA polymerase sigma factor [Bacteroidales bacterium]NLM91486.1 sigma-70 family RNA polymerase sigma factor [Bacteroidales bacterium]